MLHHKETEKNIFVIDPSRTNAWAVLPEVLFIANPDDAAKLKTASFQQRAGEAIAQGIYSFVNTLPIN